NSTSSRHGEDQEPASPFRAIAAHARAASFVIADGVVPTNEGRGYVLRRIMRRALRHGRLLGFEAPFFYKVAESVVRLMGSAYSELVERKEYLTEVVRNEEERFSDTLGKGLALLEQEIAAVRHTGRSTLARE